MSSKKDKEAKDKDKKEENKKAKADKSQDKSQNESKDVTRLTIVDEKVGEEDTIRSSANLQNRSSMPSKERFSSVSKHSEKSGGGQKK